jgi:cytochrome c peroxidase
MISTLRCTLLLFASMVLLHSCDDDMAGVQYDPTPYQLSHEGFPPPHLPADNMPTVAGVQLGRMLFYEPRLSRDNSISCASCHKQEEMFSDARTFSEGVDGKLGRRQAMAIINLAWHDKGMFWDGRANDLRHQALMPIQDTVEMDEALDNVVSKLSTDPVYRDQFIRAFGDEAITPQRIAMAIEQFEITLISNRSKYDHYLRGEAQLTASEERGRVLFFSEFNHDTGQKGGECFRCHTGPNFTSLGYQNNGLDSEDRLNDLGRFEVTGNPGERGRFKVPTLRNIALTAPYMHDGRFATLEAVIEHYNTGVVDSYFLDETMIHNLQPGGLQLNAQDVADLKAFLETLTDHHFHTDPRYSNPF